MDHEQAKHHFNTILCTETLIIIFIRVLIVTIVLCIL